MTIRCISAVTLTTHDMRRSLTFYRALGFEPVYGGDEAEFTSLRAGAGYLNLRREDAPRSFGGWGRVIFYVDDVDATYAGAIAAGLEPDTSPRDAEWGERYFHLTDPDGHALSFARPLR